MKKYTLYIIEADNGRHYIGITEDMDKRLDEHNSGRSRWTSRFKGWRVVYREECESLSIARKRENILKKQKGGNGLKALLHNQGS